MPVVPEIQDFEGDAVMEHLWFH